MSFADLETQAHVLSESSIAAKSESGGFSLLEMLCGKPKWTKVVDNFSVESRILSFENHFL